MSFYRAPDNTIENNDGYDSVDEACIDDDPEALTRSANAAIIAAIERSSLRSVHLPPLTITSPFIERNFPMNAPDQYLDLDQYDDTDMNDAPHCHDDDGAALAEYESDACSIDRVNELLNDAAPYEMCREAMADDAVW